MQQNQNVKRLNTCSQNMKTTIFLIERKKKKITKPIQQKEQKSEITPICRRNSSVLLACPYKALNALDIPHTAKQPQKFTYHDARIISLSLTYQILKPEDIYGKIIIMM